jgi:hypothetical protein
MFKILWQSGSKLPFVSFTDNPSKIHLCIYVSLWFFGITVVSCSLAFYFTYSVFLFVKVVLVKLSPTLTKFHAVTSYGGVEVSIHAFLTSALDGGQWIPQLARRLFGHRNPSGRDGEGEKSCTSRESNLGRPAHSLETIMTELSR